MPAGPAFISLNGLLCPSPAASENGRKLFDHIGSDLCKYIKINALHRFFLYLSTGPPLRIWSEMALKAGSAGRKNLGATSYAKSALQRSVSPIIQNILLPSRHKNTDLGALYFRKTASCSPARAFPQNIRSAHPAYLAVWPAGPL